ncbi:hypothetical protein Tco_0004563 [Tanacetum coccineum]
MACPLPHTFDEIQALVTKFIDEDIIRQKALMELAVQFDKFDLVFYKGKYHQLRHLELLGFPLTRVKWLPLIANSLAVSGIVIAEPGVGATTWPAAHMGSSSIGWIVSLIEWNSSVSSMTSSIQSTFSSSNGFNKFQNLEARVCIITDFTSEITDEELREFTSEYYIPSALHPVVPQRGLSIADFPVEKCIAQQKYPFRGKCRLWQFIPHSPLLFPPSMTPLGQNDGIVAKLRSLQCYTENKCLRRWRRCFSGNDALFPWDFAFYTRDGEEPLLESTAGRTMELVLEQPEAESTDVLAPTPLRSVPGAIVEPPRPDAASVGSSEDADVAEVDSGLKRKRATGDDGAGPSKRVRHVSLGLSTSTEEETPDASPTLAAKEVIETPPPNVEATSDSSAPVTHADQPCAVAAAEQWFSNERKECTEDRKISAAGRHRCRCAAEAESRRLWMSKRRAAQTLIEYVEELDPPHVVPMLTAVGIIEPTERLACHVHIESQEVYSPLGMCVKWALARGKAEAVENS